MKYSSKSLSLLELTSIACVCVLLAAIVNEAYGRSRGVANTLPSIGIATASAPGTGPLIGINSLEARKLAESAGLTGRQGLPPDMAETLVQGAPLPPCAAVETVPGSLVMQLPYVAEHEWLIVGTDLVLVGIGSDRVISVLGGVFK